MKHDLDCPECQAPMIKSYSRETKFRSKIIKWDSSGMYAVCKSCDAEVPITVELMKSIQSSFVFETKRD